MTPDQMGTRRFYLAGACFSSAERTWNEAVKTALDGYCNSKGFFFYLPQHHVEESWSSIQIHQELVRGLINADGVIANLDGPGCDDGTCWEMGFVDGMNAMATGSGRSAVRRVFWYRTDFRRGGDSDRNVNLMMAHSGQELELTKYGTSPQAVAKTIHDALVEIYGTTRPPPNCS